MHEDIKKFSIKGELSENRRLEAKERMTHFVENMMRDYGYVPSLDLEPQFTVNYVPDRGMFEFDLSVYGVWVGKERECRLSGVTNGKLVNKYIPPTKSNQS